jgi:eukaryotic-like serine/threonine-protein kinase
VTPRLEGYEVLELLSRGRDLDVYDVWSERRGCRCVAKVLRPDGPDPERARSRLLREGELLMRFTHPHLVRAYEVVAEPEPAVVLETITGATLAALASERRLSWPDAAELGLHLCSAIHYLHGEGWLHADLKPANVIAEAGRGKVIDLSLARPPGRCRGRLGTRHYAPPEQAEGGELTAAVDVWGIGATLYAGLAGRPPFERGEQWESRPDRPERIGSVRRLPRTVSRPIDACLEPRPQDRPTVVELADALGEALA